MFRPAAWILAAAVALVIAANVQAADKTHEGKVVSAGNGKLVMTDNEGKNEHTHAIAATTKITIDGKDAKLADLKAGEHIKVTQDGAGVVTTVAATTKIDK
jgi:hypothetical protein